MLIVMQTKASTVEVEGVVDRMKSVGLTAHLVEGRERVVIGAVGAVDPALHDQFILLPGVERVLKVSRPYKLASREHFAEDTTIPLGSTEAGGNSILMIAGPCSVESRSQMLETALAVKEAGAHALRGGAFKPRSSPYTFQGMGEAGLEILAEARELTGLPIVTEVMSPEQVPLVAEHCDVLQIGARNMQNYALLNAVGSTRNPVLLKRGFAATIEELLMAAEYILARGNFQVMLCERGIRTYETATRNTTDINAIPVLKSLSHLPVILDPSHSTGHWQYVSAVARAAVAAGADGLIVEVHPHPESALSDGKQSLRPETYAALVAQVRAIAEAIGRTVDAPVSAGIPLPVRKYAEVVVRK